MGENLKAVWAKFSTLSLAVLLKSSMSALHPHCLFYSSKLGPGSVLLAEVCPCIRPSTIHEHTHALLTY